MSELAIEPLPTRRPPRPDVDLLPELIRSVRRFLDTLPSALERDRARALPPTLIAGARELGLYGLAIPESFGGAGLGLGETARVIAELARVDRSLATSVGLHNGLGSRALVSAGSPALAARFLPELASGERIGSFGATEPGAGSDLSGIRTTAVIEGDALLLTGEKSYVTNAGMAGLYTVLARVPEPGGGLGSALVLVPRETPGLALGAEEHKMGLCASSTRSVFLDGARVSRDNVVGRVGGGIVDAHRALEWGRTLMSAGCLGTARAALERSLAHASQRKQFRRPLRSFGAVRAHLSAIAAAVVAIEAMLDVVATDEARGAPIDASSAALKVLASELACDACDRTIQIHGALGYVEDAGIALLLRDARVTRIFEGANEVLLVRLGSALLAGNGLAAQCSTSHAPEIAELRSRFEAIVDDTRRRLGVTAVGHQRLVTSLGRLDVWLHAAEACLRRPGVVARETGRFLALTAERSLDDAWRSAADEHADADLLDALGEDAHDLVRPVIPGGCQ